MNEIQLTETEQLAFTHVVTEKNRLQVQYQQVRNDLIEIESKMQRISKDILEKNGVEMDETDDLVLSDDMKKITYTLKETSTEDE